MKTIEVTIELMEEMLGTANADAKIHEDYIASKAPDAKSREEEVAALGTDAVVEKSKTIFPKEDGKPFLWDYQIKGFFKAACGFKQRCKGEKSATHSNAMKAYKKIIDGCIFVAPRKIFIEMPEGATIGDCQRPLRAQTAQGERVALANSESVPAGSRLTFEIEIESDKFLPAVIEWLDYGKLNGLGQWRNSGKGRFEVVDIRESKKRHANGYNRLMRMLKDSGCDTGDAEEQ